jgi:hypothetical protein
MPNVVIGEKRDGGASIRSKNGQPILEETYHFLVKCTDSQGKPDKNVSRIEVLADTPGLPIVGQSVSAYGFSVCQGLTAERREDQPHYWDVTATFSSEVEERQSNQNPQSEPTEWVPIYETKFERMQVVTNVDANGDLVANSVGYAFDTGITRPRFIPIWNFWQFEAATVSDETIIERNEVTNNATFRGRAIDTLLCTVDSSVIGFYYGRRLRFTQYSLRYKSDTWKLKLPDVGRQYLEGGSVLPYLVEGNVVNGPLNGSGGKVAEGSPAAILEFSTFPSVSFSFLRAS